MRKKFVIEIETSGNPWETTIKINGEELLDTVQLTVELIVAKIVNESLIHERSMLAINANDSFSIMDGIFKLQESEEIDGVKLDDICKEEIDGQV